MEKVGNKKALASRPKNVSNELTDHIPTHKSESRNYIQTCITTLEDGNRCGTPVWEKESFQQSNEHPLYTTCNASPQMLPKLFHGAKKERERKSLCFGGRERKCQAMCFSAYLKLGHFEYRRDIKQIGS